MKAVKITLLAILLLFLLVAAYQNREFLLETENLTIELFAFRYESPKLPIGMMFSVCFLAGMLLAYFFTLLSQYQASCAIKSLDRIRNEQTKTIANLESRLAALQTDPPAVKDR
ncbi:MAG: hypothetical protein ACOZF0_00325 [Thermodesulfobacteriota bacterium]